MKRTEARVETVTFSFSEEEVLQALCIAGQRPMPPRPLPSVEMSAEAEGGRILLSCKLHDGRMPPRPATTVVIAAGELIRALKRVAGQEIELYAQRGCKVDPNALGLFHVFSSRPLQELDS